MNDIDALSEVYREIAELIGYDNAIVIYTHFKGQQITFPIKFFNTEYLKNCIIEKYDGTNAKMLSRKYGYSERWIKELVKRG